MFAVLLFTGCCLLLAVRCLSFLFMCLFVGNARRVLSVACCLLLFCVVGWLSVVCCALCGLISVLTYYMLLLFCCVLLLFDVRYVWLYVV